MLLFCFSTAAIDAQILQDTASLNLIKKGADSIYNMQFTYSEEVYRKISKLYPEHPVVILFKGIMTYWENYPLILVSPARAAFEKEMRRCIELCEKNKNLSYESEYLLANLGARGLLLTFYADNDLKMRCFLWQKAPTVMSEDHLTLLPSTPIFSCLQDSTIIIVKSTPKYIRSINPWHFFFLMETGKRAWRTFKKQPEAPYY
jgi:hypothetical protein